MVELELTAVSLLSMGIGLAQNTSNAADLPLLGGCLAAFFLLVVLILVWVFVIAPRRSHKQLAEYRERGYVEIDVKTPELVAAIDALTPIMPEGTLRFQEGRRQTLNAMVATSGYHPRYVVHLAEHDDDRSEAGTVWRTLYLDTKPLEIETEFSTRLTAINIGEGREERFGFQPVAVSGVSSEFASLYSVFSKSGRAVTLSGTLQEALLAAARSLTRWSRFNTRFTPGGWGISVSNAYLQRKPFRRLVEAGERISSAL
jgi:hypothetical protein